LPVIVIQNLTFSTKALLLILSSTVSGLNVYVYCAAVIVVAAVQFILFSRKNMNYQWETKFHKYSSIVEVFELLMIVTMKLKSSIRESKVASYLLIGLILCYIIVDLLAVVFYWVRIIKEKRAKKFKEKAVKSSKEEI
jgi:hypothetical protein